MARVDCTNTIYHTFGALVGVLRREGFRIDHFHAVDRVEVGDEYKGGEDVFYVLKERKVKKYIEVVSHLNIVVNVEGRMVGGFWSDFREDESPPIYQRTEGWYKLVAGEKHER